MDTHPTLRCNEPEKRTRISEIQRAERECGTHLVDHESVELSLVEDDL